MYARLRLLGRVGVEGTLDRHDSIRGMASAKTPKGSPTRRKVGLAVGVHRAMLVCLATHGILPHFPLVFPHIAWRWIRNCFRMPSCCYPRWAIVEFTLRRVTRRSIRSTRTPIDVVRMIAKVHQILCPHAKHQTVGGSSQFRRAGGRHSVMDHTSRPAFRL